MGEIGVEWVCRYHGRAMPLLWSGRCARGFCDKLDGVTRFKRGDDDAWDQDFEQRDVGAPPAGTDRTHADNVDIAYFAGHGHPEGIGFGRTDKDNGIARHSEMRLGDKDLEWLVLDACEVLKKESHENWESVFSGLHYILGFDTICRDSPSRGRRFARHLNECCTVRRAWIKACKETNISSRKCAYLRANDSAANVNTFSDHWHGRGSCSADPDNPDKFIYFRTSC